MPEIVISNRRTIFLIFLILFSGTVNAQLNDTTRLEKRESVPNESAAPIAADGCTMWFEGDYEDCCRQHDLDYLKGGDNWRTRLRADNRLFICISRKKGIWHLALAPVMWTGVRIFGSDLSPSSRKNGIHKFFKRIFAPSKKRNKSSLKN